MVITNIIENPCSTVPEEVGYNSDTILKLDEHLKLIVNDKRYYAGSYLLMKNGKTIASKSLGPRCGYEDRGDFRTNTIRRIASITKTFTAVAIMQLIEEGKIHLHQPVAEIISEFDNNTHREITIFHILTHTSGLVPDSGIYFEPYPRKWIEGNKKNWIKKVLEGPLATSIGNVWSYSTAAFGILGEIIARKSGMTYENYIMEKITKPLGMERTFFIIPDELMNEVCFGSVDEYKWIKYIKDNGASPVYTAGSGLFSTAEDLAIYGQMLLSKGTYNGTRILSRKSVEAMTRNCLSNDVRQYCWANGHVVEWGLGFSLNQYEVLTYGGFAHEGAFRCGMYLDPNDNLLFVYFCPMYEDAWEWKSNLGFRTIAWSGLL